MITTLSSYLTIFWLATKRRQKTEVEATINVTVDEGASFIKFVPNYKPESIQTNVTTSQYGTGANFGMFGDNLGQGLQKQEALDRHCLFGDHFSQGVFTQLSKISQTWLDTSTSRFDKVGEHNKTCNDDVQQVGTASSAASQLLHKMELNQAPNSLRQQSGKMLAPVCNVATSSAGTTV